MQLSIPVFLTLNSLCLLVICYAALFAPTNRVDKSTVFVITLWLATSLFVTASAWAGYL